MNKNFGVYENKLHRIKKIQPANIGDPPQPIGSIICLEVLEYEDLISKMKKIHEDQGHSSVGTTLRKADQRYWHPELTLAIYEVIRSYRSCQLMRPPDQNLGNLRPIHPPPPLTPWGIDHTYVGSEILLNAVEYATG